jgi:hypothetical protein
LLIAGPEEAPTLAARGHGLAYIAVDTEGRLWGSDNAHEYIEGITVGAGDDIRDDSGGIAEGVAVGVSDGVSKGAILGSADGIKEA